MASCPNAPVCHVWATNLLSRLILCAILQSFHGILSSKPSFKHTTSFLLAVNTHIIINFNIVLAGHINLLVWTLFINLHNMLLPLLHKDPSNVPHVPEL